MRKSRVYFILLAIFSVPALLPLAYSFVCSFMEPKQISMLYRAVQEGVGEFSYLPREISFDGYYQVFIAGTKYLSRFWISLGLCTILVVAQLTVSVLAGFAFAKYHFYGKRLLFAIMILFMIIPVQVTLLPNYIVLDFLNLINTYGALILPNIFLPFGTFLLTFTFSKVPDEVIEAARVDGAGTLRTLCSIVLPSGSVAQWVL